MSKFRKLCGGILLAIAAIRFVPDLLESAQATTKYAKWTYTHLSAGPRGSIWTACILIVGICLIFSDTIRTKVGIWIGGNDEKNSRNGPKLMIAFERGDYRANSLLIVNHGGGWAHSVTLRIPEDGSQLTSSLMNILKDDGSPSAWQMDGKQLGQLDVIMKGVRKFPAFVTCMDDGGYWFKSQFEPLDDYSGYRFMRQTCLGKAKQP